MHDKDETGAHDDLRFDYLTLQLLRHRLIVRSMDDSPIWKQEIAVPEPVISFVDDNVAKSKFGAKVRVVHNLSVQVTIRLEKARRRFEFLPLLLCRASLTPTPRPAPWFLHPQYHPPRGLILDANSSHSNS
jgi:hypothetical protein